MKISAVPKLLFAMLCILGIYMLRIPLLYKRWRSERAYNKAKHEHEVLAGLLELSNSRASEAVVYFHNNFKKPRSAEHNLVYLWPKKFLLKALATEGVAVGPVPNYRAAFDQFLDAVERRKKLQLG